MISFNCIICFKRFYAFDKLQAHTLFEHGKLLSSCKTKFYPTKSIKQEHIMKNFVRFWDRVDNTNIIIDNCKYEQYRYVSSYQKRNKSKINKWSHEYYLRKKEKIQSGILFER